ncbi:undecaprenyldiphospho-muramoylpentapeptide beta-N-acetylglucosaminyltransferase [Patescibacteria group bacterium]|nr:undecaprenyldiphospho-muramoylpentapeptide beta-N-acetylglucosaminyltransferase [Patescibacteria group bacterium]MBU0879383.1 undecaprenyldiphospho-muramoylpentapeptide beta-N-acetylglucosaminyltransferase [Patescibacteria group bacterium]MBU0880439.1 undecaprenyldiphospho-muramoylpentapeptide beta-N-acetylglucosaminyltransferase [Patescibacteria group bacterium]MBU0897742.1 undecaprenyldiphospho-muramoylpentapeptide beta-N-acetylglucosaminyltransferase [Patescibacteria group bacterium]MBU17
MLTQNKKIIKLLLTGGGTGGSVAPLLAVANQLSITNYQLRINKNADKEILYKFLWIGTKNGPEREMVEKAGIKFKTIICGKLRRYFSWQNFIDIFKIKIGFWQSFFVLLKWRPDLVIAAGSFVSVPVVWAAWILHIPILIHQQDIRPGLANKLMALFAKVITVTFEKSLEDYGKKAVWIGNPIRRQLTVSNCKLQINNYRQYNLNKDLLVVLIVGGGTGAEAINNLILQSLDELTKFCQVIHLTGINKINTKYKIQNTNYSNYEFLDVEQMAEVYNLADIVVSRCGLGVLTELSYLGKPTILIPMPDSHQEDNAAIFEEAQATIILKQKELTSEKLISEIKKLVINKKLQEKLSQNIKLVMKQGANEAMVKIIERITRNERNARNIVKIVLLW